MDWGEFFSKKFWTIIFTLAGVFLLIFGNNYPISNETIAAIVLLASGIILWNLPEKK